MIFQHTGSFLQSKEEGFENVLKKLGVGAIKRKGALASPPKVTISEDNGAWKIESKTIMTSSKFEFEIGVAVEHVSGNMVQTDFLDTNNYFKLILILL